MTVERKVSHKLFKRNDELMMGSKASNSITSKTIFCNKYNYIKHISLYFYRANKRKQRE